MKRNWDTIREILLMTEGLEPDTELTLSNFDNDREAEIIYHVRLLEEAGLINVEITDMLSAGSIFDLGSLTGDGHEFLDAIRSESIWKKTQHKFIEKGGVMTFDLIKSVAIKLSMVAMGV